MDEPSRHSIFERLSRLPTRLPPRAREAATVGARLLVGLGWCGAALALFLGFAILHMQLATGRRAALEITHALLDDVVRGRIRFGRLAVLTPNRVVVRNVTVTDPAGRTVVVADRIAADVDPWRLLRGELRFERVAVRRPRVFLYPGEREYVSFLDAFAPTHAPDDRTPTPDLFLVRIHVQNGSVAGTLPGIFDIDVHHVSVGASFRLEDRVPVLDVRWVRSEVRAPVATPVKLSGRLHLRDAGEGVPGGIHGNVRTVWGRSDVRTTFGVSAARIRVHVQTGGAYPEDLRALGIDSPFGGLLRGRVGVSGPPGDLDAIALMRVEAGRLRARGRFTFGPPPRYRLHVTAEGIDLARLLPDRAPSSTLGISGVFEGEGLTRGTLEASFEGELAPGVVDGYPIPGGAIEVHFDVEGVEIARFEPRARGLAGTMRGRVSYEGAVDARGELHAHRLSLVHGLRRIGGSASARFRFRRDLGGRLELDADGAGRGLEFGPVRFGEADVTAHVRVDWPDVRGHVQARGTGLVFSGVSLGTAQVKVSGDRRAVRLSLRSVDPEERQSVLEAVIHPDPEGFTAQVPQASAGFVGEPLRGSLGHLDYRRDRVTVRDLVLVRGDARLTANGTYDLAGVVDGEVTANNLDLAELKRFLGEGGRAIEGRMGIRLEVHGPVRRPDFDLSAEVRGGRYGGLGPLEVFIQAEGRGGMLGIDAGLELDGTEVVHVAGDTPLDLGADGLARWIGPGPRSLDVELSRLDLDRFGFLLWGDGEAPPVDVVLTGLLELRGTWADPAMKVRLSADRARAGPFDDLTATLQAEHARRRTRFELRLHRAGEVVGSADGTYEVDLGLAPRRPPPEAEALLVAPLDARVAVGAVQWSSLPSALQLDPPVEARVVLAGTVAGSLRKPTFDGEVDIRGASGVGLPWAGALGGHLDVGYAEEQLTARGGITDGSSIVAQVDGALGIDLPGLIRGISQPGAMSVRARFEDVPVARMRWLEDVNLGGHLKGTVQVSAGAGPAVLRVTVESTDLRLGPETLPSFRGRIDYSGQLLTLETEARQYGGGELRARATWRLPWTGELGSTLAAIDWPLSGEVSARRFSIESLRPSIPEVAVLEGRVDGAVTLSRFEEEPHVNGHIVVHDGVFEIAGFGQRLTRIEARVTFQGVDYEIESLRFRDRRGTVEAKGGGRLENLVPKTFSLDLDVNRFPLVREGSLLARISGRAKVEGRVRGRQVEITAKVRGAQVQLPARPTRDLQALDPHPDIVIAAREAPPVVTSDPIMFLVHAELGSEMWMHRSDLDLALLGEVDVRYPWGGKLTLAGTVELVRGQVEAYGRRFQIDHGVVTFEARPDLNPVLDVTASWDAPQATVYLHVTGRLSRPRIAFSSSESFTQDQIVALLVLGRVETRQPGEQDAANESAARQTAALLSGIGAALAQEGVREALPDAVPIVAIEPGEEGFGDARYRAGSQVAERLYVEGSYRPSSTARQGENSSEVRIEYRLSRRWSVESHAGDENSGADLLWSYSY